MKPFVWRGKETGAWYVDTTKANPAPLFGTLDNGYETWREAYEVTCHAIASEPA